VMWQKRNGLAFTGQGSTALMSLDGYQAADVLDHRTLCYDYVDLTDSELGDDAVVPQLAPPQATPPPRAQNAPLPSMTTIVPVPAENDTVRYSSKDRGNLACLRYPDTVSDDWCQRNNIPVAQVRTHEGEYRTVYTQLNAIKGYVSPCALWKRPTLCRLLLPKVQQFYVDASGIGRVEVGYQPDAALADPYQVVADVHRSVLSCSPDMELPPAQYGAAVQRLTGPSAFDGAGSLKKITDMDAIKGGAATASGTGVAAVLAAVAVGLAQQWV